MSGNGQQGAGEPGAQRWSVVGRNVERVDGLEKVSGAAQYVADVKLPGVLEAKVLRSPYPHARVLHVDTSRARRLPGVVAVVAGADSPKRRWGTFVQDQYPLAVDRVRYVGDELAAVAAVDADVAQEALALIQVEYEELPAVFDPAQAMQPDAPRLHEECADNVALHLKVERGDVERALAAADVVVEGTFESAMQWIAALETIGTVAQLGPRGKLTLWMNDQTIFVSRARIAWALGLEVSDVRVIQTAIGGGFGGKTCDDNNPMICGLLAMRARGRPVRLINSREEEFLAGSRPRVPMKVWLRLGFRADGLIVAKDMRLVADNGAYCAKAPGVVSVAGMRSDTMYRFRDVRSEVFLVYTNKIPTGAFRGFGMPSAEFALGQVVDMGAERLGLDPKQVALANAIDPGHVSVHGNRVISCELTACIEQATAIFGWEQARQERRPYHGFGLAAGVHVSGKRHHGDYDGSSVLVEVGEDGKVAIWSGEGETGQGATTILCQMAAEALGVRYEDVSVSTADTATTPHARGAYASRLTFIAGNALLDATRQVREQLLETAAELLEASADDLEIAEGRVRVRGLPQRSVSVAEVARKRLFRKGGKPIVAFGTFDANTEFQDAQRFGNESPAYGFCCHAVEVAVDPDTGRVEIVRYLAVSDGGTVIHPVLAEVQVEGAVAQGLGYATTEGMLFDQGRPLNSNFSDYRLPCIADMPPFQQVFVPSYEPTGPFGAKGLGELGLSPVAPALANAIYDAVGVRVTSLPLTAEKVFWALRGGAGQRDQGSSIESGSE
ncbi:MAG: molybdopterin-dependent oxidoreductase [Chloroflexi bacterium]|nr:molybdopterin-dependent oxidoreductase [Chloroflexota bacterium]